LRRILLIVTLSEYLYIKLASLPQLDCVCGYYGVPSGPSFIVVLNIYQLTDTFIFE